MKTTKNIAQATETPRISTETAETANVSAEGENKLIKHITEVLEEAEQNYQCVKSEMLHTVREADGKWHTYFMGDEIGVDLAYDQINHIPAARTAQAAEEIAEIRRYMNWLNGNHIADADFYLAEMREGIKRAEAARRKKNADAEGENKAERAKYRVSRFGGYKIIVGDREQGKVIAVLMAVNGHNVIEINDESAHIATMGEKPLQMDKPITQLSDAEVLGLIYGYIEPPQSPETKETQTIAEATRMVNTELAKNKAMRTAWHLEFPDGTECDVRHKCTAAGCDFYEYTEVRESEETFKDYKATEHDVTLYICQRLNLDAQQPSETPHIVA